LFGVKWMYATVPLFILYASLKEFWYDQNYETEEQRGSNLEDWGFYMIGLVSALLLWCFRLYYDYRVSMKGFT
jgi:hypothetical protein